MDTIAYIIIGIGVLAMITQFLKARIGEGRLPPRAPRWTGLEDDPMMPLPPGMTHKIRRLK